MYGDIPNSIATLADALLANNDDDIDLLEVVAALRPLLAPAVHFDLSVACGLCPVHGVDYMICADDARVECGSGTGLGRHARLAVTR